MNSVYDNHYDIVISGGGVSGAVAGIAAARNGANVIVIEQYGFLGGALTANGVGPMMTFHAGELQVIKGIMEEIVQRLVKHGYSPGHIKDTTQYISYLTPFSSEGLKIVLDELLEESNCKVLFHTFIGGVDKEEDFIKSLTVCNKDGINKIKGKVFIDATGDGDIANFSGVSMTKGRKSDGAMQPMTMNIKYSNVNVEKLKSHIEEHKEEFPRMVNNIDLMKNGKRLSFAGFQNEFNKARKNGEIDILREEVLCFETNIKGEFIVNTTRILGYDSTNSVSLSEAEKVGRKQCVQLNNFLKKYIPGFEEALLVTTGPNIGIRGSRQLQGSYTLTENDILSRQKFDTTIAHSAYPIDIHNPNGEGTDSSFVSELGTYYNIPYEVMVNPEVKNLLVTGRCVSATFEAQAAIRTTPTVGALGHACGIAAVLAAKECGDVSKVNVKTLQSKLIEENAFLTL